MADISKLNLTGSDLDIKDSVARGKLTVVDPSAGEGLITFGVDANGNYGYKKVGADTVTPFKTGGAVDPTINNFSTGLSSSSASINTYRRLVNSQAYIEISPSINVISATYVIFIFLSNDTNMNMTINLSIVPSDSLHLLYANNIYMHICKFNVSNIDTITNIRCINNATGNRYFYAYNPSFYLPYILI